MQQQNNHQLNLFKLKRLINSGLQSIPIDPNHKSAIMVIGDTGVGKTTILSFLAKRKLFIKVHGLNTILDSEDNDGLRIGHDRFSQTRVPTKVIIDQMVFFDCSGFKDNRGQQFEISNSFFVQRLFNIYQDIKVLLIVDESSISQARADKLPKLIRNLLNSFDSLTDIQDGVILLINRAKPNFKESDYSKQILKMAKLSGQDGPLFKPQQRAFLQFLVKNKRVSLFKQAQKEDQGKVLDVKQENLLSLIRDTNFVKSKKIKNIISESAKLSIREFIDHIALDAEPKIKQFAQGIIKQFTYDSRTKCGNGLEGAMDIKRRSLSFSEQIQNSSLQNLMNVLSQNTNLNLSNLQEGICTVIFFKNIYDKAEFYVKLLKSTISAEITKLLVNVDQQINRLQEQQRKFNELQNNLKQQTQKTNVFEQKLSVAQNQLTEIQQKAANAEQSHRKQMQEINKIIKSKQQINIQKIEEIKELKQKIIKMQQQQAHKDIQCAKQKQIKELEYEKLIENLKNQLKILENKTKEDSAIIESMKEQIEAHIQDLQLLNIQNASLKKQLDYMSDQMSKKVEQSNQSMISKTSKTSKYPEVQCHHFKNGGKCIHCIKAWKAEQREKRKMQKQMESMKISDQ